MDSPIELVSGRLWACYLSIVYFFSDSLPYSIQMLFRRFCCLVTVSTCASLSFSTPPGFPSSGNGLWYTAPGTIWEKELLPVGNGYLAGMS